MMNMMDGMGWMMGGMALLWLLLVVLLVFAIAALGIYVFGGRGR